MLTSALSGCNQPFTKYDFAYNFSVCGEGFENYFSSDLTKEEYSFGRGENCDVPFSNNGNKKHQCFQAYSKVHFKITRVSEIMVNKLCRRGTCI